MTDLPAPSPRAAGRVPDPAPAAPRRVLVTTTPIPAHTFNAAAVVTALVAAGTSVSWHAPRRFHEAIEALGAQPVDVDRAWDPEREAGGVPVMGTLRQVRGGYRRHIVGRAGDRAADVADLLHRCRPDLVLCDTLAYGAGLAAERAGLPWVSFGDGPLHDRDADTPPFGSGLPYRTGAHYRLRNRVVHRVSDRLFAGSAAQLAQVRDSLRLAAPPAAGRGGVLAAGVSPWLHLHGGVPGLEYPPRRPRSGAIHFVGCLYHPVPYHPVMPDWTPSWLAELDTAELDTAGRPIIAVTQGSLRLDTSELIEPTIAALADRDVVIVVAAGSDEGARRARLVPTRRAEVLAAAHVPFDALARSSSLFITNGGWTGVTTALAHGVPVLQAGRTEEKADIGRRVEWSRCGVSVRRRRLQPDHLRSAVDRWASTPALTAGLAQIHAEFAARDAGLDSLRLLRQTVG